MSTEHEDLEKEVDNLAIPETPPDFEKFCEVYKKNKDVVDKVIRLLKAIPRLKKLGQILEFLARIADKCCAHEKRQEHGAGTAK